VSDLKIVPIARDGEELADPIELLIDPSRYPLRNLNLLEWTAFRKKGEVFGIRVYARAESNSLIDFDRPQMVVTEEAFGVPANVAKVDTLRIWPYDLALRIDQRTISEPKRCCCHCDCAPSQPC
jgi:hypothetical protein